MSGGLRWIDESKGLGAAALQSSRDALSVQHIQGQTLKADTALV